MYGRCSQKSSVWRNCYSHELTAVRYIGGKSKTVTGHLQFVQSAATTLTNHGQLSLSRAAFNDFSWPLEKLRQKKKNQRKNCSIKVIKGRVVNFQTIFIQDHCSHLSCFPQKPKQLTASKSSLPQQTVQTDQDNQDRQTEKSLQISLFTSFLCSNWKALSAAGTLKVKNLSINGHFRED